MNSPGGPNPHRFPPRGDSVPAPRHEDALTQRAWSGAATLIGLYAVLGGLGTAWNALDSAGPWASHGLVVQALTIGVLMALGAFATAWAVRGYRYREARCLLYAASLDGLIFLTGLLVTS